MIEVNSWLFIYGLAWALIGQMGALYVAVRLIEGRARRRAKLSKGQPPSKIWRPGQS